VGGAIVGGIVLASGGLLAGNGHLAIPPDVFGGRAWYILAALALAKIVATVITLGSGGSGGVFTPALFIGAAVGGSVGTFIADVFPNHVVHPASWAVVGMAGLVSGATRAPLTAIFIVYELTNDSGYVVPLMIVSVIAYVTAKRFAPYGLYDGWLAARGQRIAHGVDQSVMEHIRVSDALDAASPRVGPATPIEELVRVMGEARRSTMAVVEDDGTLLGLIGQYQLHDALAQPFETRQLIIAEDLIEALGVLQASESLRDALTKMSAARRDALPVVAVDRNGRQQFLGLITRSAAFEAYDRALEHAV
jgi:CIC family chloride channel protein